MIILLGDYVPGIKHVEITCGAEYVLCNLEGPVLPRHHSFSMSPKAGPNLFSYELPDLNNQFVFTLANNHIMDFGVPGLESTLELLDKKRYRACGAGKDVHDARQPIVVVDRGIRIGIIGCCEAQFGVARRNQAGVAEFSPWVYQAIRDLCKTLDAVIVSVHAAVEDSPWPSPYIRELYHSLIDAGASVVHGHHSHMPQGYEIYGSGMIFYGMGNFAVDPDKWIDYPNGLWSLAAEIDFSTKPLRWHTLTFEIRHQLGSNTIVIEESNNTEQVNHRRYLEICNRFFVNPETFDALWQEVALRVYYHHGADYMRFPALHQNGRLMKARSGLSMIKRALFNRLAPSPSPGQNDYLLWYHMIVCESHRQMLATSLGLLAGEIKDLRTEETRLLADEMMSWPRYTT